MNHPTRLSEGMTVMLTPLTCLILFVFTVGLMIKKKVYIPIREYPDVNFLGLLIGPRGRTQKELEARTGARILVRGRGSQKDNHYSGPTGNPDDDDDQHVSIEGTEEAVAKAQIEVSHPYNTISFLKKQFLIHHYITLSVSLSLSFVL